MGGREIAPIHVHPGGLTIALISLFNPTLREQDPKTSGYQPYCSAPSTPSTRPSLCVVYAEYVTFTSTR